MATIDHIGIAVENLQDSIKLYQEQFGCQLIMSEELPQHGLKLAFVGTTNTLIELLEPTSPDSVLGKFLSKRGPGLHHICFKVDDIQAELARYLANGFTLIDSIPRPGAFSSQLAFLHPTSTQGTLIELTQHTPSKV